MAHSNNETLTFIRIATKSKDGQNGFLYRHSWATGFQDIIFDSKEKADLYISKADK